MTGLIARKEFRDLVRDGRFRVLALLVMGIAVLALGAGLMAWPGPPAAAMAAVAVLLGVAAAGAWLSGWRADRRVKRPRPPAMGRGPSPTV